MERCKKCEQLIKKMDYPDKYPGYEVLLKTGTGIVYLCEDCGRKIYNTHKRYGYQTEYLPVNNVIDESDYKKLKLLGTLTENP